MSADKPIEDVWERESIASLYAQAGDLMASYQEHAMAWQREMLRIGFAEIALLQSGFLTAMRVAMQRPQARETEQQRFADLADMWLRLGDELQAALLHAFLPKAGGAAHDRRTQSIVINFPERRAA